MRLEPTCTHVYVYSRQKRVKLLLAKTQITLINKTVTCYLSYIRAYINIQFDLPSPKLISYFKFSNLYLDDATYYIKCIIYTVHLCIVKHVYSKIRSHLLKTRVLMNGTATGTGGVNYHLCTTKGFT